MKKTVALTLSLALFLGAGLLTMMPTLAAEVKTSSLKSTDQNDHKSTSQEVETQLDSKNILDESTSTKQPDELNNSSMNSEKSGYSVLFDKDGNQVAPMEEPQRAQTPQ